MKMIESVRAWNDARQKTATLSAKPVIELTEEDLAQVVGGREEPRGPGERGGRGGRGERGRRGRGRERGRERGRGRGGRGRR